MGAGGCGSWSGARARLHTHAGSMGFPAVHDALAFENARISSPIAEPTARRRERLNAQHARGRKAGGATRGAARHVVEEKAARVDEAVAPLGVPVESGHAQLGDGILLGFEKAPVLLPSLASRENKVRHEAQQKRKMVEKRAPTGVGVGEWVPGVHL